MEEITTTQARSNFSNVTGRVQYGKERIAITRRGKIVAYVVSVEDVELLEKLGHEV